MALVQFTYASAALKRNTEVTLVLPEKSRAEGAGRPDAPTFRTVYLLHGNSGDHSSWMRRTSIERYAGEYGVAVVMPDGGRCWYTDTAYGANYFTYITEELPAVCRSYFKGMSDKREDNFIIGNSMGGYGALKAALTYPERYGGCASLSGALDVTRKGRVKLPEEWRSIFDFELKDADELAGTKHDLFALAEKRAAEGSSLPKLWLWCGTEDGLIDANRRFHALLEDRAVPHAYAESEGDHSWKWWDLHVQDALAYLLG